MLITRTLAVASLSLAVACGQRSTSETESATVAANAAPLRNTYWKLTALGDKPVIVAESQREPHLILQPDSKQANGSGGCNRMFASYELNGDALTFSAVGSTKMACNDGMDIEASFLPALSRVARWQITGQQLELRDASGAVIARFDAKAK